MGDPAEENDPPPESRRFLTQPLHSVNWKKQKKVQSIILTEPQNRSAGKGKTNGARRSIPAFRQNPNVRNGRRVG